MKTDNLYYYSRFMLSSLSLIRDKLTMFQMKEKYAKEIVLQNIPALAIDALLNFIYTGVISLNLDNAVDILEVASFSQTPGTLWCIVPPFPQPR